MRKQRNFGAYWKRALLAVACMAAACNKNELITRPDPDGPNPYVAQVLDYRPAVGQFTNLLPRYEPGDTQHTTNAKSLAPPQSKTPVNLGCSRGTLTVAV